MRNYGKETRDSTHRYCVTILGHLPPRWVERFDGMEIHNQPNGTTNIIASVPDQAALYGLIIKCRDMGLTLLAINQI